MEPILHRSFIFDELREKNFSRFSKIMKDAPESAFLRPNTRRETPIHKAAAMHDTQFLQTIIQKTKSKKENTEEDKLSCKDSKGRSPIFNACEKNNRETLKILLAAGYDPDEEDRLGLRPLQVALINNANKC